MIEFDHLLSVGATGMLADAIVSLARRSRRLTSVARTDASLRRLASRIPEPLPHQTLRLDYRDHATFLKDLRNAIESSEPVETALVWMHGDERDNGVIELAKLLGEGSGNTDFYHVVGSSGRDLATLRKGARREFEAIPGISYHRIVLGFVEERGRRRWLSDREISEGVVRSMALGSSTTIVGKLS